MKTESIAFALAGIMTGALFGYVLGFQQGREEGTAAAPLAPAAAAAAPAQQQRQPPPLDEAKAQELRKVIDSDPKNAVARAQLGNVYFDAEQWGTAIQWYEQSLAIDPGSPDVNTDLGVSYYYTNRTDAALAQFEKSLTIDPNHTKTLLNKGIVLAFGKENLNAAAEEWKKVVTLAPDSPEGQAARRALEGVAAAHATENPPKQ